MGRKKDGENRVSDKIAKIVRQLKMIDDDKLVEDETGTDMMDELIAIGKPAVFPLIELLRDHETWMSSAFAADVLGKIGDPAAIGPLADALEDLELGENACGALEKFGPACVPDVIRRVEHRIAHPLDTDHSPDRITLHALRLLGRVRCEQSSRFLNGLLDDYISEMPDEAFDPSTMEWKYINVDFFQLLDSIVKQQNKDAIPHIEKALERFSKEYTEYLVCRIAIGRIRKGRPEGYLPMEAMEIAMPSGAIMDALSGGELGWEDPFDEEYGEYFDDDDE